mmetsp:Transcript_13170/g.50413  ORF Transcript_13170/g.50413 Transcript_13170/m.50413 type:complete len:234 (+) Transcript_13170:318-1019(+)
MRMRWVAMACAAHAPSTSWEGSSPSEAARRRPPQEPLAMRALPSHDANLSHDAQARPAAWASSSMPLTGSSGAGGDSSSSMSWSGCKKMSMLPFASRCAEAGAACRFCLVWVQDAAAPSLVTAARTARSGAPTGDLAIASASASPAAPEGLPTRDELSASTSFAVRSSTSTVADTLPPLGCPRHDASASPRLGTSPSPRTSLSAAAGSDAARESIWGSANTLGTTLDAAVPAA